MFLLSGCTQIKGSDYFIHDISSQKVYVIHPAEFKLNKKDQTQIVVIIDVFRAFTTAAYILEKVPKTYILAKKSTVISQLATKLRGPILIGKSEQGVDLAYDIPNSPTRTRGVLISGKDILHRTEAGAGGLLLAKNADIVLAAGFVNASATAKYIRSLPNAEVIILPMGHEGTQPSLEDDICAEYIKSLIEGRKMKLTKLHSFLKSSSGKYFFSQDQWQYPKEDFYRCLAVDYFDFVIKATVLDDYAILSIGH